jgi:hypothetical protein
MVTHPISPECFGLFFLPHGNKRSQARVSGLRGFESVEGLHQDLADTGVAASAEKLLRGVDKLFIDEAGEPLARVVGENADEHDGVVLARGLGPIVLGHVLADQARTLFGGDGRRNGRFNDRGEVDNIVALESACAMSVKSRACEIGAQIKTRTHR